jgi:hypothetical protein
LFSHRCTDDCSLYSKHQNTEPNPQTTIIGYRNKEREEEEETQKERQREEKVKSKGKEVDMKKK